jgi:4-hydroxy-2-oxoheptanedioate aldolase
MPHVYHRDLLTKQSVPGHDHAAIGYALDAGASIVVPQVDTVEQAKHVVSSAKFGRHHRGTRSVPPARLMPGLSDIPHDTSRSIWENLNDQAAIIIQIESLEGINNLDAILTEVGDDIDAVWLGSLDARVSMGLGFSLFEQPSEPEWLEAMDKYNATLKKHDKPNSGFGFGPPEVVAKVAESKCIVFMHGDVFSILGGMGDLAMAKKWPAHNFSAANKASKSV